MSEEQFWHANPRIIKVWEETHKREINQKNWMMHIMGIYVMNAVTVAVDHCMNGKKAKTEYMEEPIRLFQMTEAEKAANAEKELQKFISWGNGMIKESKNLVNKELLTNR